MSNFSSSDLDQLAAEARIAATEAGGLVVDAVLSLNEAKVPVAGTPPEAALAVIKHAKPRLIYLSTLAFDARDQILAELLLGDDEDEAHGENLLQRPRVKRLVEKWSGRDGQTSNATLGVFVDGVLHGFTLDAEWLAIFEEEVSEYQEEREWMIEERQRKIEIEHQKRLGGYVKKLRGDARFNGPKVGKAKREVLAESLFSDVDKNDIRMIVELAEREDWLAR